MLNLWTDPNGKAPSGLFTVWAAWSMGCPMSVYSPLQGYCQRADNGDGDISNPERPLNNYPLPDNAVEKPQSTHILTKCPYYVISAKAGIHGITTHCSTSGCLDYGFLPSQE